MNKVILVGRLTRDPELRYTQGDNSMAVCRYTLAVDRGKDKADFPQCVAFGKAAEFADKYFKKGMRVAISGRLQTGSYMKGEDKVYTTEVVIESQEFAQSKTETSEEFMTLPDMPW